MNFIIWSLEIFVLRCFLFFKVTWVIRLLARFGILSFCINLPLITLEAEGRGEGDPYILSSKVNSGVA